MRLTTGNGLLKRSYLLTSVNLSLKLLPSGSRGKLLFLVAANMVTAFLDLAGVILIGVLGVALVASVQTGNSTSAIPTYIPSTWMSSSSFVLTVGVAAAFLLLAKSAISAFLSRRTLMFLARRQAAVTESLVRKLFRRPLVDIEVRTTQETAFALTGGVAAAIVGLLGSGALALSEVALLVVLGIGLMVLNPIVTMAAIAFFALMAVFLHFALASWAGRVAELSASTGHRLTQAIQESLASYRELTVLDRMDAHIGRLSSLIWASSRAAATGVFISQVPKYVYETALLLAALCLGAWEFSRASPADAVATVSVFLAAGSRIMPSMLRLQNSLISIRFSSGLSAPTYGLYSSLVRSEPKRPAAITASQGVTASRLDPVIALTDVTVTYPGASGPALESISLIIPAGTSAALVGPTGAGKSTLADVMLGVLPVTSGTILIGEQSPRDAIRSSSGQLAYVPQTVSLVSGSIRDNVALGLDADEVDDQRIWDCLRMVRLDDYLRSERDGLSTMVGERGVKLSGGQRQRLGLARALYANPALLVLDEATSALDAETESAISATLRELHGQVTVVVVAHRLATVRNTDQVFYIEDGHLLGRGNFEEVRRAVPGFDEAARLLGL